MYKMGVGRKEIELDVAGRVFAIKFVSVFARKRAGDLFDVMKIIEDAQGKSKEEALKAYESIGQERLESIIKSRSECLENILISNGYDYDPDWWERSTGYEEQNEFIYFCLLKDTVDDKKKAVKKASAS